MGNGNAAVARLLEANLDSPGIREAVIAATPSLRGWGRIAAISLSGDMRAAEAAAERWEDHRARAQINRVSFSRWAAANHFRSAGWHAHAAVDFLRSRDFVQAATEWRAFAASLPGELVYERAIAELGEAICLAACGDDAAPARATTVMDRFADLASSASDRRRHDALFGAFRAAVLAGRSEAVGYYADALTDFVHGGGRTAYVHAAATEALEHLHGRDRARALDHVAAWTRTDHAVTWKTGAPQLWLAKQRGCAWEEVMVAERDVEAMERSLRAYREAAQWGAMKRVYDLVAEWPELADRRAAIQRVAALITAPDADVSDVDHRLDMHFFFPYALWDHVEDHEAAHEPTWPAFVIACDASRENRLRLQGLWILVYAQENHGPNPWDPNPWIDAMGMSADHAYFGVLEHLYAVGDEAIRHRILTATINVRLPALMSMRWAALRDSSPQVRTAARAVISAARGDFAGALPFYRRIFDDCGDADADAAWQSLRHAPCVAIAAALGCRHFARWARYRADLRTIDAPDLMEIANHPAVSSEIAAILRAAAERSGEGSGDALHASR